MRKRWSKLAGMVALLATGGAAAAAFQIDPDLLTQVSSPATGLWVPATTTGEIVRVDVGTGEVTARVTVGDPGAEIEIEERDHGVVVVDRTAGQVLLVDPGLHQVARSLSTVAADRVDIGPEAIVLASTNQLGLVGVDMAASSIVDLVGPIRSIAADGTGAIAENSDVVVSVDAQGIAAEPLNSQGLVVRVRDEVMVIDGAHVRDSGGSETGCFVSPVLTPEHLLGSAENWTVAVDGTTVHVADLNNGECVGLDLGSDIGPFSRPVVAERRIYLPERSAGVVHIIDPARESVRSHQVLSPGDLRVRNRGGYVVAYDVSAPSAVLLDADGFVRQIDMSEDGRGITAVVGDSGTATVVSDDVDAPTAAVDGADGVNASADAPIIDASLLATSIQNGNEQEEEELPDDDLVANFAFSATTVAVGEPVRFVDASTGSPESWLWDFGDGTGDAGPEVEKTWTEPGTFPVTLEVGRGEERAEISLAITVVPVESAVPPAADFVFSATVVDAGDPIEFEDRSDGDIERWRWDFGDGTSASEPDVAKSWAEPGRYEVRLTVANEQGSDSASIDILVVAGLQAPVAVIAPVVDEVDLGAPVSFSGSSATDPASFSWDFGDGETRTGAAVVHVYETQATFTVTLTAENDAGSSTAQVTMVVNAPTVPPQAAIATLPPVIEAGNEVSLTSLSTNSPDSEEWTFDDGGSASGKSVVHTWAEEGTYLLTLTATNSAGTDVATEVVEVVAELPVPDARIGDFNAAPWVGEATVFFDASLDATSWMWDFGDGGISNAPNPLHTFTTPGQKTVTLTVSNRNGSDVAVAVVEPRLQPSADFSVSSSAVRAGDEVSFIDQSVNAVKWFWDFGDGSPLSGVQNPVHTYSDTGVYSVSLTIENATGDLDTAGPVDITVDPAAPRLSGILGLPSDSDTITTLTTAFFEAQTAGDSGPIDLYEIDFGDGSGIESDTSARFSHVYGSDGTYEVEMRARGPLGDWSEWVGRTFSVVDPPPPRVRIDGTVPSTALIGSVDLGGEVLSGSGPIDSWRWDITGPAGGSHTGQLTSHNFEAAGVYTITLTAQGPVANDIDSQDITIVVPPAPTIVSIAVNPATPTAGSSTPVTFVPDTTGSVETWEWSYEGGPYIERSEIGLHIFNNPGSFDVSLRVTGPFGGQDVMGLKVTVNPRPAPTTPVASPASPVLTGTTVGLSSTDANGLDGLSWAWEITNGAATFNYGGQSISHTFAVAGSWTITVTATDSQGETGTAQASMIVEDPTPPLVAGFSATPAGPLQIQFSDTSTGPAPDSWSWDFGAAGAVGDPSAQNPLVTYLGPGTYSVTLVVGSGVESDSTTLPVNVV